MQFKYSSIQNSCYKEVNLKTRTQNISDNKQNKDGWHDNSQKVKPKHQAGWQATVPASSMLADGTRTKLKRCL